MRWKREWEKDSTVAWPPNSTEQRDSTLFLTTWNCSKFGVRGRETSRVRRWRRRRSSLELNWTDANQTFWLLFFPPKLEGQEYQNGIFHGRVGLGLCYFILNWVHSICSQGSENPQFFVPQLLMMYKYNFMLIFTMGAVDFNEILLAWLW